MYDRAKSILLFFIVVIMFWFVIASIDYYKNVGSDVKSTSESDTIKEKQTEVNVTDNKTISTKTTSNTEITSTSKSKPTSKPTTTTTKKNYATTKKKTTTTTTKSKLISLGKFKLTAYCACSKCCGKWSGGATASGVMPKSNRTIAVDTSVIPFGTKVVINGNTYVAEDTGSAIKGKRIDVYMNSHQKALNFGVQYAEVFIVKS